MADEPKQKQFSIAVLLGWLVAIPLMAMLCLISTGSVDGGQAHSVWGIMIAGSVFGAMAGFLHAGRQGVFAGFVFGFLTMLILGHKILNFMQALTGMTPH